MDDRHSQLAWEVFRSASGVSPDERQEFIDRRCAGDEALRAEVLALLAHHEEPESTLAFTGEAGPISPMFGSYRIEQQIGAGGMGQVWSATDLRLGRRVAIKILPPNVTFDPSRVARFENEARTASALNHPNILTVHELGEAGSMRYIVTELVEGGTLRERINQGPLPLGEALEICRQMAAALAAAHEAGVVHRDVKPENVMIRPDGLVKVLDFGLAKLLERTPEADEQGLTKEGSVVGTPGYMSPEQLRGEPVDSRTDVWSLGLVIYEMVTGKRPFLGDPSAMVARILRDDPPPVRSPIGDIPPGLESLVLKALQKERDMRHGSARELLDELHAVELQVPAAAPPGSPGRLLSRRAIAAAVVVATILLGSTAALLFRPGEGDAAAVRPETIRSIAVLPFANLSGEAENEHLSDGMTDELIHALGKVPGLNVVSRTSSFALKGQTGDAREVGHKLGVGALVDGSVNKSGNRLRVTAQLVSASTGYQLWSEVYDRELTDVFAIEEEIATAVARALATRLGDKPLVTAATRDMEAYELYLKGRQASQDWVRAESLNSAISSYRAALERDPSFAPAWAGLADVYSLMDHTLGVTTLDPSESYRLAREAADRALELDPVSAEALAALGHIQTHQGEFDDAKRNLRRAVELNPSSGMARLWFAVLLRTLGQKEAIEQYRRAREADPLSHHIHSIAATGLWIAGEYALAAEFAKGAITLDPDVAMNYYSLARALAFAGRREEAENALHDAITHARRTAPGGERALVLAVIGRREEAMELLRQIDQKAPGALEPMESPIRVFRAWAALGDSEKAAEYLDRAVTTNPYFARVNIGLPTHPVFQPFIEDSRYREARGRLGLPAIR